MKVSKTREFLGNMKLFIKAAFDMGERSIPTAYYTLEILPYIAEDLEGWERRVLNRKSVVNDRWGDFCC